MADTTYGKQYGRKRNGDRVVERRKHQQHRRNRRTPAVFLWPTAVMSRKAVRSKAQVEIEKRTVAAVCSLQRAFGMNA